MCFSFRSLCLLLFALTACAIPQTAPVNPDDEGLARLFSGRMRIVDMTHALSADTAHWPSSSGNPFERTGGASMGNYSTPEHHGTHLDAPVHASGTVTVDELLPQDLLRPAAVIDVATQCAADPDYQLRVEDLLAWEARNGPLPAGAIVVMYSGWGEKYPDQTAYANDMHFPGFSAELATFLVEERDIRGIGVDTLSVDAATAGFGAHRATNGANKYHLENMANVQELPESGAYLIVAPIKIAAGSGGQVRIFGVIPDEATERP